MQINYNGFINKLTGAEETTIASADRKYRKGEKSMMEIKEREFRVLEIVDRLRICQAVDIAWLAGYTDYTYCRKKLGELENSGLLQWKRDPVGAKCYFLTRKGLNEIGKHSSRPYEVSFTTNHTLVVARICTWLHIEHGANVFNMMTDMQLRKYLFGRNHRPDILLYGAAYEAELNHKKMGDLTANILANSRFDKQVWIIPNNKMAIARNLMTAAKAVEAEISILGLNQIERAVASADVHKNTWAEPVADERSEERLCLPPSIGNKYSKYFNY